MCHSNKNHVNNKEMIKLKELHFRVEFKQLKIVHVALDLLHSMLKMELG